MARKSLGAAWSRRMQSSALLNSAIGMLVHVLSGSAAMRGASPRRPLQPLAVSGAAGQTCWEPPGEPGPRECRALGHDQLSHQQEGEYLLHGCPGDVRGDGPSVRPGPRLCGTGCSGQVSPRGSVELGPRVEGGRRGQRFDPQLPSLGEPSNPAEVPLMRRRPAGGVSAAGANLLCAQYHLQQDFIFAPTQLLPSESSTTGHGWASGGLRHPRGQPRHRRDTRRLGCVSFPTRFSIEEALLKDDPPHCKAYLSSEFRDYFYK